MAITINGSGITSSEIADGTIVNADVNDVAASKLTGTLPTARLPAGCILQVVAGELSSSVEGSTDFDIVNVNITPKQADSDMLISVYVQWSILATNGSNGDDWGMELYRDSTSILGESNNNYFISGGGVDNRDWVRQGSSEYGVNYASKMDLDTGRSSGTSQINYKLAFRNSHGSSKTVRFMRDGWGGTGIESQRSKCTIIVQEVST